MYFFFKIYWVKNLKESTVIGCSEVGFVGDAAVVVFLGKRPPWLSVDTALYILKESEEQAEPQLMCFTELRNREVYIFFNV